SIDADVSQTSMQLRQSLELSSLGPWMTSPESLWSPSVVCGLSTPPDNLTPSTSVTDLAASMSSQLNRSGMYITLKIHAPTYHVINKCVYHLATPNLHKYVIHGNLFYHFTYIT
ncbi:unnamed protein product, partial [Owenia fusiformis]